MYSIVCGVDAFGRKLLKGLLKKGHEVVAVEKNEEVAQEVHAESNAVVINGDPTSPIVLEQAGAGKADVLIANLPTDVENLALCVLAKKYGVAYVIANVHDPDYLEAFNIAGVDKMLAAVDSLYEELINVIESPSIKESVELGEYKLFVVDSDANERVAGKKPGELEEKNKGLHFLASLKGGEYSGNRQAKIPENALVVFLAEKKREERIRKLFRK